MEALVLKILIVDDQEICRIVLKVALKDIGNECIEAENGEQAIALFKEHSPDLVLLDVVMPVMDGFATAPVIKELAGNNHTPIIFLTSNNAKDALKECLACGGDDFLQKPVDTSILVSKIKAHMRTKSLMNELQDKSKELEVLHETLRQEHETGQHVLSHSLSRNLSDCKNVRSYIASQSTFNGDICLFARKPFGGLYIFLGDLTGHGLAAAIGTIPLSQVFFTMTRKGKPAASIVREMNRSLRNFVPRSMFCAAGFIELDASGERARVWLGGLPACYHVNAYEGKCNEVLSKHLPLGILENEAFNASMDDIDFHQGDSLLLMTDGIPESTNSTDEMFGMDRVAQCVSREQTDVFEEMLSQYHSFVEDAPQHDDVSLLEVMAYKPEADDILMNDVSMFPWKTSLMFNEEFLRKDLNIASEVFYLLPDRPEFAVHQETIATVVTELFCNALDHGILQLCSSLKQDAEGFENYYLMRAERLAALSEASIEIKLEYGLDEPRVLDIEIIDSGAGFDISGMTERPFDDHPPSFHGRGLTLVESLCRKVRFNDKGNSVRASIRLA